MAVDDDFGREPPMPLRLSWTWVRFERLTGDDVYDLLALRSAVFVVEQDCVFLDADGLDRQAWHLLGRSLDAGRTLIGYLRCIDPGVKYPEPSIGRVVVDATARGSSLGRAVMHEGIVRVRAAWPGHAVRINAQYRLEAFYASLGFVTVGPVYVEDDIEHVEMTLAATTAVEKNTAEEKLR